MKPSVESQVQSILADILSIPREDITPYSSPDTIQIWDSLQHLNFVLALEQAFGLRFLPEEIERLTSVNAVVEVLESKIAKGRDDD
jgi:acyl carrier protein